MPSEGLGEMFEGNSADMGAGKFPLTLMGGWGKGHACADPGARTPIDVSRNCSILMLKLKAERTHTKYSNPRTILKLAWSACVHCLFFFLPVLHTSQKRLSLREGRYKGESGKTVGSTTLWFVSAVLKDLILLHLKIGMMLQWHHSTFETDLLFTAEYKTELNSAAHRRSISKVLWMMSL